MAKLTKDQKRKKKSSIKNKKLITKKNTKNRDFNKGIYEVPKEYRESQEGDEWFGYDNPSTMGLFGDHEYAICVIKAADYNPPKTIKELDLGDWFVAGKNQGFLDNGVFPSKTAAIEFAKNKFNVSTFRTRHSSSTVMETCNYDKIITSFNGNIKSWKQTLKLEFEKFGYNYDPRNLEKLLIVKVKDEYKDNQDITNCIKKLISNEIEIAFEFNVHNRNNEIDNFLACEDHVDDENLDELLTFDLGNLNGMLREVKQQLESCFEHLLY